MKKLFLLTVFWLLSFFANAQLGKEAWHWQFGNNVSLDFSNGSPPIAGVSSMNVYEGCASISDPTTGQLLFYTDGDSVWDRNNNRMPNGIGLINGTQGTTTQAATIVPKPGSKNIYYLITADYGADQPNGVFYSIVDMNLNGGMGDVTIKNTQLTAPQTTEKVVATRHCNTVDYWILTHSYNSNNFNAYLVTSSGINPTPVVSSVGTVIQTICCGTFEANGYLKVSPNGKRLASCIYAFAPNPILELYDFDNSTGQISNPITIPIIINNAGNWNGPYGCSFSPDNTKLYISILGDYANYIFQFDLSNSLASTILASCDTFTTDNIQGPGALQLAPDGKIYVTYEGASNDSLGVINSPNSLGSACNYKPKALGLDNNTSPRLGLPNFIDGGLQQNISTTHDIVMCNSFSADTVDAGAGFAHYYWSTGDTTQKTTINSPGKYWVSLTSSNGCVAMDTLNAYVISPTSLNILKDTITCSLNGKYYTNVFLSGILKYNWSDGTSNYYNTFDSSGTYWVDYTLSGGCIVSDSFKLTLYSKPKINLGHDTLYCGNLNQGVVLNANGSNNYLYSWSTTAVTESITVNATGTYWVKASTASTCFTYDTISIVFENTTNPNILHDTVLCSTNQFPIILNATIPTSSGTTYFYVWQGGHIGTQLTVNAIGTYVVSIFIRDNGGNLLCKLIDTSNVSIGCSDIKQINSNTIKIYPNPAQNNFTIETINTNKQTLQVFDINGNLILSQTVNGTTNIDVTNLPAGVYNICLINPSAVINKRLVIIK